MTTARVPVAVLGATGIVGQRFVARLAAHPWFELVGVCASARSVGRRYGDAVRWVLPEPVPAAVAAMEVRPVDEPPDAPLLFSALDAAVAGPLEPELAAGGRFVVTNASAHRMDAAVPLVVAEVNGGDLDQLGAQEFGAGALLANPNCSAIGLTLALKPLLDAFGLRRVHVVTMQAASGAGFSGPTALELVDNLIPWISGEEEKLETESRKILGRPGLAMSAQCHRVPVLDGHTLAVSVELERDTEAPAILAAWEQWRAEPQVLRLPSAPERPVRYWREPDAPQPRRARDLDGGMVAHVGRLRPCPLLGWKFVTLSHNTIRGAAGGAILAAELAVARGWVDSSGVARR